MGTGAIIALVGSIIAAIGGWGRFFFERSKTSAEAESVEITSSAKINQEWENIYNKLKSEFDEFQDRADKQIEALKTEVEALRKLVEKYREELETLHKENGRLQAIIDTEPSDAQH